MAAAPEERQRGTEALRQYMYSTTRYTGAVGRFLVGAGDVMHSTSCLLCSSPTDLPAVLQSCTSPAPAALAAPGKPPDSPRRSPLVCRPGLGNSRDASASP
jgi:hypothetical protein